MYLFVISQIWKLGGQFLSTDYQIKDIIFFIFSFLFAFKLYFFNTIFYPHANLFIQTTWIYQKVFGEFLGVLNKGFTKYTNIGKDIPRDYYIRGQRGSVYTISSSYKTKFERVKDQQTIYLIYLTMKFLFKDLILRFFIHFGIFIISPIIFLFAVPVFNNRGVLKYIEK
ncbi:hypothetical protein BTS2_1766 [Bacillus sp. TS-2]|nr:hypothetical protein BTS2_1766 [Bacillus sp. TS-2]